MLSQEKYAELDKVIAANKGQGGAVMRTLQAAQDIFGHVPKDVQIKIAEGLGTTLSEVYGVATFYSQFALEPAGKFRIGVCLGIGAAILCAACLPCSANTLDAALAAACIMGEAGRRAASRATAPGSFAIALLDALAADLG